MKPIDEINDAPYINVRNITLIKIKEETLPENTELEHVDQFNLKIKNETLPTLNINESSTVKEINSIAVENSNYTQLISRPNIDNSFQNSSSLNDEAINVQIIINGETINGRGSAQDVLQASAVAFIQAVNRYYVQKKANHKPCSKSKQRCVNNNATI